ncbi:MAG: hypothetical protein ACRBDL_05050 [Alphaproteobacteria bacterium]
MWLKALFTIVGGGTAWYNRDEIIQAGKDTIDHIQTEGIVESTKDAGNAIAESVGDMGSFVDKTGDTITGGVDKVTSAYDKASEFADTLSGDNEGGINWMKWLGIGGATAGGGWLLKSLFSGNKDENDNGSSFLGGAVKAALVLTVVGVALNYALKAATGNGLTETFAKFTGGDKDGAPQITTGQKHTGQEVQESFGGFGSALSGANSGAVSSAKPPQLTSINTNATVPESVASQVAMNDSIDADKFTSNGEKPAIFNMKAVAAKAPSSQTPKVFGGQPEEHYEVG